MSLGPGLNKQSLAYEAKSQRPRALFDKQRLLSAVGRWFRSRCAVAISA